MKNQIVWLLTLCVIASGMGCRRDCGERSPKAIYALETGLMEWMGDSAALGFDMISSDSITETWLPRYGNMQETQINITCQPRPMRRFDSEYRSYHYVGSLSRLELNIRLSAWENRQDLGVDIDDLAITYNPIRDELVLTSTPKGTITATRLLHDSLVIGGKTWLNVLELRTDATFVTYKAIWIAKGWGMVRLEGQNGKRWDRKP